jgi:MoxR-like ATPase
MSQDTATEDLELDVDELQAKLATVREEVGKRLVGQQRVLDDLLACVLCDGNALLESNPGLAKTLTVRTLANVTDLEFSRVQNTPDLMPSDITGTEIIREGEGGSREFVFEQGPVFANIVLADEINRATPKTQAALLEAMEEQQVTAAGETYDLPEPFFVMATQNPIEQEGSLHPDETLLMNGELHRAGDALDHAREHGTLIHERDGTRLYDVEASTQTFDEAGRMRETDCLVYEVDYEGEILAFRTKTGRTIRVTEDHPFLVNRDGRPQWIEARNVEVDDHLVTPASLDLPEREFPTHDDALDSLAANESYTVVRRAEVETLRGRLQAGESLSATELDRLRIAAGFTKRELSDAVVGTYDQVLNFFDGASNGLRTEIVAALRVADIETGDYVEAHSIHRFDDVLDDADAGFFIGFVLAEGHIREGAISVTQKNLPGKLDRWLDIAEEMGFDPGVREKPTGREARITSKPLVDYLDVRFDLHSPERLLSAPETFRREFLEVFLLTESHFDAEHRRLTFVQKDRTLTNLVAHMLLGYGIVPWVYDREERYELRVQGEDVARYVEQFEWRGETPEVEEFESAHRTIPLSAGAVERVVDALGMKHDEPLSDRDWYNSYNALQSERDRMATSHFEALLADVEETLEQRTGTDPERWADDDLGEAAKACGLSMTDVAEGSGVNKNRVWEAYQSEERPSEATEFVVDEYTDRIAEAEALTDYFRSLLDGDVFFDRVTEIDAEPYEGPVVGLSVPRTHNYVAGMGACGLNHNTYPLPEAQTDRFLVKIVVDYPEQDEELEIVDRYTSRVDQRIPVDQVFTREEIREAQTLTREVPIADDIRERAVDLVRATREADHIEYGASPRASMGLVVTAKARALIEGRAYVSEDDVERMAKPVLRHRIVVDFRAERDGMTPDDAVEELL